MELNRYTGLLLALSIGVNFIGDLVNPIFVIKNEITGVFAIYIYCSIDRLASWLTRNRFQSFEGQGRN